MSENWISDRLAGMAAYFTSEAQRMAGNAVEIVTPHNHETAKRPDAADVAVALNKISSDASSVAAALSVVLAAYQGGTLPATATKIS